MGSDFLRLPSFSLRAGRDGGTHPSRIKSGLAASFAAAAALTALLLVPRSTFLTSYDCEQMHFFYKEFFRRAVLSGQWPFWNPYTALGRPFLADIETACLYPPNWVVLALGPTVGIAAIVGLHVWLALAGTLRLMRLLGVGGLEAWTAAATFTLGYSCLGRLHVGQIQYFCALAWLPLLLCLAGEAQDLGGARPLVRLALACALAFLAGSPPAAWVCALAIAVFTAGRAASIRAAASDLARLSTAALLAAGLAAAQLLPFLELVRQGNRPLDSVEFATLYGESAGSWISLLVPAWGSFAPGPELNLYIGVPFALAGACGLIALRGSRNGRAFLAVAVVFALLSCGARTPVLGWLAACVPPVRALRFPGRYGAALCMALIAGAGLILHRLRTGRRSAAGGFLADGLCVLQLGLLGAGAAYLASQPTHRTPYWDADLRSDLAAGGLLAADRPPPRVAIAESRVRPNSGMAQGYSTIGGFSNPMLKRVWDYEHAAAGVAPSGRYLNWISPEIYGKGAFPFATMGIVAGWDPRLQRTVIRADPDPRAWLAYSALLAAGGEDALRLAASGPDLHPRPIVESAPAAAGLGPKPADPGNVRIESFRLDRIELRISSRAPALLVLAEAWYPGWKARVNGDAAPVWPVNYWMRGLRVPSGESDVVLEFAPSGWAYGCAASAACAALSALLWRRGRPSKG